MAEWKNRVKSRFGVKKPRDNEEDKTTKIACFQKTVYSDSIIVDAVPQHKARQCDSTGRYVKENGSKNHENVSNGFKSPEQHLTRNEVIHMLKTRFKDDLEDWQCRDRKPVDVRSEPSRSPKLSPKKRYGQLLEIPDVYPTLPRKPDGKLGGIWLQCGDEVKQAQLPREGVSLEQIRQMFQRIFHSELETYTFGTDRSIVLIKDPFSREFKELEDARYVLPGSHLKLIAPKKKPCLRRHQHMTGKNVSFEERRRSRSFSSEVSYADSTASAPTRLSRARVGSYSFHGHPHSSYNGTLKRGMVTSTPKPNHTGVQPGDMFTGDQSKLGTNTTTRRENRDQHQDPSVFSFDFPSHRSLNHTDKSLTRHSEPNSPAQKVRLPGLGAGLGPSKRSPSNPVEEQLASLTNLLQEALRTDSVMHVNTIDHESSSDSLNAPPRPTHLPLNHGKKRSPSDSGTESLVSEHHSSSPDEPKLKPPPPYRSSSREAMKSHSSPKEYHTNEKNPESPRRSIARPRVWIDTTNRIRDDHIKVTAAYLKKDVKQLRIQLQELRNQHEYNGQVFSTLLSKTGQQIMAAVEGALPDGNENHESLQRRKLQAEEMAYQRRSNTVEKTMRRLESEIEILRDGAVNYKSSVKTSKVDEIYGSIENVSRSIASLKSDFGAMSTDARLIMAEELHSLIEEERFLKEEPDHLDQLANRCRHVAGTLFTLQKLASAQKEINNNNGNGSANSTVRSLANGPGIMKERDDYNQRTISQFVKTSKVKYDGIQVATVDYNQISIPPENGGKTKVRFNDSADHVTYHQ